MEECVILVDNSNVFIEGRKFSAKKLGLKQDPYDTRPRDSKYQKEKLR